MLILYIFDPFEETGVAWRSKYGSETSIHLCVCNVCLMFVMVMDMCVCLQLCVWGKITSTAHKLTLDKNLNLNIIFD